MREIQHLSRLYVAWLFVCAEETKMKSAENLKVMQDNIAKMQASITENETKVQELTAQIHELQKKKDQVDFFLYICLTPFGLICLKHQLLTCAPLLMYVYCSLGGKWSFEILRGISC